MVIDKPVRLADGLHVRELPSGWTICINPKFATWFRIDRPGRELLDLVDGKRSILKIAEDTAQSYGIGLSHVEADVRDFFTAACDRQIVVCEGEREEDHKPVRHELHRLFLRYNARRSDAGAVAEMAPAVAAAAVRGLPETVRVIFRVSPGDVSFGNLRAALAAAGSGRTKYLHLDSRMVSPELVGAVKDLVAVWELSGDGSGSEAIESLRSALETLSKEGVKQMHVSVAAAPDTDISGLYRLASDFKCQKLTVENAAAEDGRESVPRGRARGDFIRSWDELFQEYTALCVSLPMTMRAGRTQVDCEGINYRTLFLSGVSYANCGLGTGTRSIDVDGSVYPCPHLHLPEHRTGNVMVDDPETVERRLSDAYARLAANCSECSSCELRGFCDRGCRAAAYAACGDIEAKDPACESIKRTMWKILEKWAIVKMEPDTAETSVPRAERPVAASGPP